jgi:hypothetical protein
VSFQGRASLFDRERCCRRACRSSLTSRPFLQAAEAHSGNQAGTATIAVSAHSLRSHRGAAFLEAPLLFSSSIFFWSHLPMFVSFLDPATITALSLFNPPFYVPRHAIFLFRSSAKLLSEALGFEGKIQKRP